LTFGFLITGAESIAREGLRAGLVKLAVGLAAAAFLIPRELRRPAPLLPLDLMRIPIFGLSILTSIVSFAGQMMAYVALPFFFQGPLGKSAVETGLLMTPWPLAVGVVAPIAGRLADRIGPRPPMVVGLALTTLSLFLQTRITVSSGYTDLLPAFFLMGIGMALVMSPMSTAAMNAVPATKAGVASGILSMNRMVGGTFGVALLGTVFTTMSRHRLEDNLAQLPLSAAQKAAIADNIGQSSTGAQHVTPQIVQAAHDAFIHGFTGAMVLSVSVAAIGVVVAATLIQSVKRTAPEPAAQPEGAAEAVGV
jgi:MFS family permease